MISNLKERVNVFLKGQQGTKPGYFKFSISGDLYPESVGWGLDASAFAAKLYQMLGLLGAINIQQKQEWISFIQSFENEQGEIFDPLVVSKGSLNNKFSAFRRGYFGNFFGAEVRRAQTRQSWATFLILGARPRQNYALLPQTFAEVEKYLGRLNWKTNPWNAASHAGQLLSFYGREQLWFNIDRQPLIKDTLKLFEQLQNPADGSWHGNLNLPNHIRVNAAMKILSGLEALGQPSFRYPEKLIDLCLAGAPEPESCSIVDRIYVLYQASRLTQHRSAEIRNFAYIKMAQYEANFRPAGGFSFYPERAQDYYYGARLTKSYNEADMQGTVLGVWGVVLLAHLLDLSEKKSLTLPTI